ncbi:hypothetical protein H8K33_14400 [Undibacterium amnicola]|uniref:Uncharacterized protein n=1 Tax=Undibacterium amnicola TaxID=1834038 RepID=A0ABR6XTA3_9BURK|nr:hypothetical protein [Undibacterium amnicola]MBC3832696.1 hypothetical protein [Undibacterium amnicola]
MTSSEIASKLFNRLKIYTTKTTQVQTAHRKLYGIVTSLGMTQNCVSRYLPQESRIEKGPLAAGHFSSETCLNIA